MKLTRHILAKAHGAQPHILGMLQQALGISQQFSPGSGEAEALRMVTHEEVDAEP